MTITDTPPHQAQPEQTQVLFEEARQRRKRRWLLGGITAVTAVVLAISIGLLASRGGGSIQPVAHATPPPAAASSASSSIFSVRPVLCYAAPYSVALGEAQSAGPLPSCSPSTALTASNLAVSPQSNASDGYTVRTGIGADPQFASYPSTTSSNSKPDEDVLLSGGPGNGTRYVLGPAGLTRTSLASTRVRESDGQWTIDVTLTGRGAYQWDRMAQQQFHAVTGIVVNGHVISAPLVQPTQSSFTSFDGQLQISGGLTKHQAEVIAAEL